MASGTASPFGARRQSEAFLYASCAAFFFCTRTFWEFEVSSSQASAS
jgi:hypothetical protein